MAQRKKYPEALAAYQKASAMKQEVVPVMKLYATHQLAGNAKAAEMIAQQWLKDHPQDLSLLNFLAEDGLKRGNLKQAAEQYRSVLKLNPKDLNAQNNLAWTYQQLKDPRALPTAEAAYKAAPNSPLIMDTLAMILLEQGDKVRSLELLQKASGARPNDVEIATHLAMALLKNGRRHQAKAVLEKAKKTNSPFLLRTEFKEFARQLN